MTPQDFWNRFEAEAVPDLIGRELAFRKMFQYLDTLPGPITIVETGCVRLPDTWNSDGMSTVLFDWYVQARGEGSLVHTVDLDPGATRMCRSLVSPKVNVHTGDSVAILGSIRRQLKREGRSIDLLYLDSYDLDWDNPTPSAVHHLKELVSIIGAVVPRTLVVIDDCTMNCRVVENATGGLDLMKPPVVGGKGTFVAEYAEQVGARRMFSHYQVGWTHLIPEEG